MYYADPARDLPSTIKPKQCIFYAEGLKIYGQIPYILQRKLGAKFYSNETTIFGGGRLLAPTREPNYTVVAYRRIDDRPHSEAALKALFDWLYADAGFEWAFAVEFRRSIRQWNALNPEPATVAPGNIEQRQDLERFFLEANHEGADFPLIHL